MKIAHWATKQQPTDSRQDGVTQIAMQPRHRAGQNPPGTDYHYKVAAVAQLIDELRNVSKIIAVVGIAEDHELATRLAIPLRNALP